MSSPVETKSGQNLHSLPCNFEESRPHSQRREEVQEVVQPIITESNQQNNQISKPAKKVTKESEGQCVSRIKKILNVIRNNPRTVLKRFGEADQTLYSFIFTNAVECSCVNFDRVNNTRRESLEDQMIKDVTDKYPSDIHPHLRYLSLGSGGLLQDFINVSKLFILDYKKIDVMLVDNNEMPEEFMLHFFRPLLEAAEEKNIELNLEYRCSITEVEQNNYHIIQAIDFEECEDNFADVFATHKLLDAKGVFSLAFKGYNFRLGKTKFLSCVDIPPGKQKGLKTVKEILALIYTEKN